MINLQGWFDEKPFKLIFSALAFFVSMNNCLVLNIDPVRFAKALTEFIRFRTYKDEFEVVLATCIRVREQEILQWFGFALLYSGTCFSYLFWSWPCTKFRHINICWTYGGNCREHFLIHNNIVFSTSVCNRIVLFATFPQVVSNLFQYLFVRSIQLQIFSTTPYGVQWAACTIHCGFVAVGTATAPPPVHQFLVIFAAQNVGPHSSKNGDKRKQPSVPSFILWSTQ